MRPREDDETCQVLRDFSHLSDQFVRVVFASDSQEKMFYSHENDLKETIAKSIESGIQVGKMTLLHLGQSGS